MGQVNLGGGAQGKDPAAGAAAHWTLDPSVLFLNHGSFGACPGMVLAWQTVLRARLEQQPVRFFRELEPLLDEARNGLAALLGADPDDLGFVPNTTTGVSSVLRSLRFRGGDELLATDHGYNSCNNALRLAAQDGAEVVVARVPFPLRQPAEVVEAVLARVSPRTRLALIDHVTSPTGLVFPVEQLVPALQQRGVAVLVDGAHAPGMLPLDLRKLNADYYAGNCHKWLCAPKGSAFLHVRRDRQQGMHAWAQGHGANSPRTDRSRFRLEFDWVGTVDPTPWLCLPAALRFLEGLIPGGLAALQRRNRSLALDARELLCETLGIEKPAPDELIGSLAAVPLPESTEPPPVHDGPLSSYSALQRTLLEKHRIEVPVMPFGGGQLLRISAQAYNSMPQYEALAAALKTGFHSTSA